MFGEFVGFVVLAAILVVAVAVGKLVMSYRPAAKEFRIKKAELPEKASRLVNFMTRRGLRGGDFMRFDRSGRAVISMYGRGGRFTVRRRPDKVIFLSA